MNTVHEYFQVLYGKSKTDKIKKWSICVIKEDDRVFIHTTHGYVDGKQNTDVKEIKEGKNIGKANETSIFNQAVSEARSDWNKKKDKNYRETIEELEKEDGLALLPMLALKYKDCIHKLKFPCCAQIKLNGVRCLAKKISETKIEFTSRTGKAWKTLAHIEKQLLPILKIGEVLDGEIYNHDLDLHEIVSRVTDYQARLTEELEYWVYDVVDATLTFEERNYLYNFVLPQRNSKVTPVFDQDRFITHYGQIKFVESVELDDNTTIDFWHDKFVELGYEGLILRNKAGMYRLGGYRSSDLLKYKKFIDEEFEIISYEQADGTQIGCIKFVCINHHDPEKKKNNGTFTVVPKYTLKKRREMFLNWKLYIGKKLTVRYFNLTPDNVPFHPVGVVVRDYE